MARIERGRAELASPLAGGGTPLPPLWRDPWAGLVVLCLGFVLFAARGVPLGEPVADDFYFLEDRYFRPFEWFGGGGSQLYWRPLSRQLYYWVIAPFAVPHPGLVAALQACLLAIAGLALYRALRPAWSAPVAAAAAAFPLALEASFEVVSWSSGAQDLFALLFGMLSLHALSRARTLQAMVWLACALLSKETAIAFAAAMPIWPALAAKGDRAALGRDRLRVAGTTAALVALWWLVRAWVMRRAGQLPPPGGHDGLRPEAILWAARHVWLEALNAATGAPLGAWMPAGVALVVVTALAVAARSPAGRARLRASLPWLAWAAVWSLLALMPIAWYWPSWGSFRAILPVVGVGVALVALLASAGAWAVGLVSAMRLSALLLASPVPERMPSTFEDWNTHFDRASLGFLQELTHEVRVRSTSARPTLPRGARIVRYQWPRTASAVFAEDRAFRVWYRDSTVRVIGMLELEAHPEQKADLAIEFEPGGMPRVALIAPDAMQRVLLAADSLRLGRAPGALNLLADLERQQPDSSAALFLATGLSLRGAALLELGRDGEAGEALARAVRLNPDDGNAHRLLAELHVRNGRPDLAVEELQRHLRLMPGDEASRRELEKLAGGAR